MIKTAVTLEMMNEMKFIRFVFYLIIIVVAMFIIKILYSKPLLKTLVKSKAFKIVSR